MKDCSYDTGISRCSQLIRCSILSVVVLVAVGFLTPSAILASDCAGTEGLAAHSGISRSQLSILMVEGRDPAHFLDCDASEFVPISPNQRSIQIIEGKDPANSPMATPQSIPASVVACADNPQAARRAC